MQTKLKFYNIINNIIIYSTYNINLSRLNRIP